MSSPVLVNRLTGRLTVEPSQDLLRRLDPNEGLAPFIPAIEEALDGVDERLHAGEDSAVGGTAAQDREPGFKLWSRVVCSRGSAARLDVASSGAGVGCDPEPGFGT